MKNALFGLGLTGDYAKNDEFPESVNPSFDSGGRVCANSPSKIAKPPPTPSP